MAINRVFLDEIRQEFTSIPNPVEAGKVLLSYKNQVVKGLVEELQKALDENWSEAGIYGYNALIMF